MLPKGANSYLHIAASVGHLEIFENIFENKEIWEPTDNIGMTPFHIACQYGNSEIANFLIKNTAKLWLENVDKMRRTAFHLACKNGHLEIAAIVFKNFDESFINAENRMFMGSLTGLTAFQIACIEGHIELVELILRKSLEHKKKLDTNHTNYSMKR